MRNVSKWLVGLGIVLMLGGGVWWLTDYLTAQNALQDITYLMEQLDGLLPETTEGTLSDQRMPVLSVEGQDIVAVVELPAYGIRLPVGGLWESDEVIAYPRRFSGSAYDRTLVIGGSDRSGQLDCLDRVELGDTVTITDMTGGVFTYEVSRVDRSDSAEAEKLTDPNAHLTLFVRDTYSLEYVIVRCVAK